ncbi:MAG: helix-turn-helix transcriptional regulator [Holophagae bacterium]|nr:helix-turn-helix transcriptional regulator [Holophagae bacterium]
MYSRVRKELGLSIKEFASLIDVSEVEVENWENGVGEPGSKTAKLLSEVDTKIRVYRKIRDAAGTIGISDKYAGILDDIRQQLEAHQPEKLINLNVDEVLVDHLSFAIADYFSQHNIEEAGISKSGLAKHIYEHIKFLF